MPFNALSIPFIVLSIPFLHHMTRMLFLNRRFCTDWLQTWYTFTQYPHWELFVHNIFTFVNKNPHAYSQLGRDTMESVRGHWKTTVNGERPGESMFAIQCSPCCSPFAAPFPIYFFQCSLFKVRRAVRHSPRRSPFAAPFAIRLVIRRAVRHSPRHSLRRSPFAAPFPIHFPQFSLFKLRYSMFAAPLAIRSSPFAVRRAIRHSPRHSLSLFTVPWRFP